MSDTKAPRKRRAKGSLADLDQINPWVEPRNKTKLTRMADGAGVSIGVVLDSILDCIEVDEFGRPLLRAVPIIQQSEELPGLRSA